MVPGNSRLTERLAALLVLSSTALTTSVTGVTSSYINLLGTNANYFQRYMAVVQSQNNTGVLTVAIYKASDTSGTGATAIASTTLTGTLANGSVFLCDVNGALIDTSNPYIAIHCDTTGTGATVSGVLLASDGRYDPSYSYNVAAVTRFSA